MTPRYEVCVIDYVSNRTLQHAVCDVILLCNYNQIQNSNLIIDKHQHMHFFTFNTVFV